jgi:hypothetical protein
MRSPLFILLCLSACTSPATWSKPGSSAGDFPAASEGCQRSALQQTRAAGVQDPIYGRAYYLPRRDFDPEGLRDENDRARGPGRQRGNEPFALGTAAYRARTDAFAACMSSQGWQKAGD